MDETTGADSATLSLLRRLLLGLLLFSTIGVLTELYLLEHYAARWQWTPIYLLTIAPFVVGWALAKPSPASLRTLQVLMVVFVLAGVVGVYQHYTGNAEFELEIYEDKAGFELVWDSLRGAFPTLAPGTMTLLGLVGLASILRHPELRRDT